MYETSGTVLQALLGGNIPTHVDTLLTIKPFSLHEQRATVGLRDTGTIDSALSKFNRINEQASPSVESGLRYISQGQSIQKTKKGYMADYDFCTEILDSTRGPYSMECIQKEFLRQGGKKDGSLFPSVQTMPLWNSQPSWLDTKKIIERLKSETESRDRVIQERASREFYGGLSIPKSTSEQTVLGVEIFWFSLTNIFVGRRIRQRIPKLEQSNTRAPISFVFFTDYSTDTKGKETRVNVISDSKKFALELNRPLSSLTPLTTYPLIKLKLNDEGTRLTGYWAQTGQGRHFKVEPEIDPLNLSLTQDPYAPMISFQVYRDPHDFGADFNFADKRMGGLMMKWGPLTGIPGWVYTNVKIPFVKFRRDSSMKLQSSFKMYSFITMTILMRFNSLPNNFVNMEEYIAFPGVLGKIAIRCIGNGTHGQGVLQLYCESETPRTTTVGTVRQGVPYLIVIRIHRTNEYDIYSVNGISVGAQEFAVLQENPSTIEYTPLLFSDPSAFSNPDTRESRTMVIGNGDIDIMWIHMYDYFLNSKGIEHDLKHLNL